MKKLIFAFSLLSAIFATTGCHILDDDEPSSNPSQNMVPPQVQDFIDTNYNGFLIDQWETEDLCNDVQVYEVELENGSGPDIDLYFDLDWNFLFEATDIPNSALPNEVLATIQTEYPGYTIEPGSSERFDFPDGNVQYHVELVNSSDDDIELVLDADGSIVCTENDDDDDDDGQSPNIPSDVLDFISNSYPGFQAQSAEQEDLCGDVQVYEVELENGSGQDIDLYFDLDWNFLFEATDIPDSDLPIEVLATIQTEYPGYTIEPGSSERFDFPDGNVQYQVELENSSDDDIELVLNADGSIVCTENDDDDDDDDDDDGQSPNIPSDVLDFINNSYPGFQAQSAEQEDLCGDVQVYEVELENGSGQDIDLYFDLDWNFLFEATDIPDSDLPIEVLATIQTEYPGYTIEPGSPERFDFPDGSVEYQVELVNSSDDDIELVLDADGSIVCTDAD